MRLATIDLDGHETAAVMTDRGAVPLATDLFSLVAAGGAAALTDADLVARDAIADPVFRAPWRRPGKIWGIGLNYRAHAADLDEQVPDQPGSFMKPATAVIGPGEPILLPPVSERVTAEAELAVVIGRRCRGLAADEVAGAILGFTCVIDMTAEDILRRNPRYLTYTKSFDGFFSFGPVVVTRDEIDDLSSLTIRTVVNGETRAENVVGNMTFDPYELVRFHSQHMTWEPGDLLSTGTPGAFPIQPGDVVRCEIDGFPVLENPVIAGD